jgi:catechol 2,3-dioxygenase-like lactoylglutathione lyase family enzyme
VIRAIHHVQLTGPPGCEEAARDFWVGVVGMTEIPKPPQLVARGGVWFASGPVELHVGVEEPFTPARKAHPALVTDDLDGLAVRLADRGHTVMWEAPLRGYRRLHSQDAHGNRLEFLGVGSG